MDIMPNLTKLGFEDVDTHFHLGLKRKNCTVTIQTGPTGPKILRPMKWDIGADQAGFMNLLFMPHFGHSLQANTHVKNILVCFHIDFLWLDRPYPVDVELISSITRLRKKGHERTSYLHQNRDTNKMKHKYNMQRMGRGFIIPPIKYTSV